MDGEDLDLTATEYKLLVILAERRGRVQSRSQLPEQVWDALPISRHEPWTCTFSASATSWERQPTCLRRSAASGIDSGPRLSEKLAGEILDAPNARDIRRFPIRSTHRTGR